MPYYVARSQVKCLPVLALLTCSSLKGLLRHMAHQSVQLFACTAETEQFSATKAVQHCLIYCLMYIFPLSLSSTTAYNIANAL